MAPNMRGSIIAMGASCFVSYADDNTVLKGYEIWVDGKRVSYYERNCEDALTRENLVYKCLGKHPQILQCYGLEEVHRGIHSLRLELAPLGNIRHFIRQHQECPLPEQTRLQMSLDVAVGLNYIHSKQIQHSDLSCRNLLLFEGYRVKICDFGGSIIKGYDLPPTVCEESHYELSCRGRRFDDRPPIKRELFALGSAIYEIMAWKKPFEGFEDEEVEARYAREEFPPLEGILVAQTMWDCWNERYDSADDVVMSLKERMLRERGSEEFRVGEE